MNIGQKVSVPAPPLPYRKGYTEWILDSAPTHGIIEYISKHGFVVVNLLSKKTGLPIYNECFWRCELEVMS